MSARRRRWVLYVLWLGIALLPLVDGWSYYLTPFQERPHHDLHDLYGPTGVIGHGLGILGSLMIIVGVLTYSLRKRWSRLEQWGPPLQQWLRAHIFLCTLGPFFVLLHTTFKVGNVAAISFWSMATVVGSGIFGRYVYARIPKTVHGEFRSEAEVRRTQRRLAERAAEQASMEPREVRGLVDELTPGPPLHAVGAVVQAVRFGWQKTRLRQKMKTAVRKRTEPLPLNGETEEAMDLLMESAELKHRHSLLAPFQRLFGYWHVLHIPLASVMFITLAIHVAVAIAFGYTWIF
jgi:hypothetical protein